MTEQHGKRSEKTNTGERSQRAAARGRLSFLSEHLSAPLAEEKRRDPPPEDIASLTTEDSGRTPWRLPRARAHDVAWSNRCRASELDVQAV
jgi:hypothetical protein